MDPSDLNFAFCSGFISLALKVRCTGGNKHSLTQDGPIGHSSYHFSLTVHDTDILWGNFFLHLLTSSCGVIEGYLK